MARKEESVPFADTAFHMLTSACDESGRQAVQLELPLGPLSERMLWNAVDSNLVLRVRVRVSSSCTWSMYDAHDARMETE